MRMNSRISPPIPECHRLRNTRVLSPHARLNIPYLFTVPDYLPPGVTVDGTLRATGGGIVRENRLTLQVGM